MKRETNVKLVTISVFIATFMTAIEERSLQRRCLRLLVHFMEWKS